MKEKLVAFSKDSPEGALAEFAVGVHSLPYLADHGFQDMIVLPGSLYIEMASCVHFDLLKRRGATIRNANFQHSVILSEDETTIRVVVGKEATGASSTPFMKSSVTILPERTRKQSCAVIDIDGSFPAPEESRFNGFSIKDFTELSAVGIQRNEFYGALRAKMGTNMDPDFSIWRPSGVPVTASWESSRFRERAGAPGGITCRRR